MKSSSKANRFTLGAGCTSATILAPRRTRMPSASAGRFSAALSTFMLCLTPLAGCVGVEPRDDYARARSGVRAHTGAHDVFDPEDPDIVQARTDQLLADGLTLDESVRVALLNNRAFQALFDDVGASRADVVQSALLTNPSLALGARFPEGGGRSEITLGFAQDLVDLWQIPIRKKIAQAELEATVLGVVRR